MRCAAFGKRCCSTVSTIGFCLVHLPLTPLLTRRLPFAATLASIAVVLARVCLTLYARLILLLLVPEEEIEATPGEHPW